MGLICAVLAVWLAFRRGRASFSGAVAVGMVTGHERRSMDDSTFYHPIVQFTDAGQVTRRFTSVAGASSPTPPVGERVTVRYVRSNPEVAYIATFLHMWAAPLALLVLAGGALIAAARM